MAETHQPKVHYDFEDNEVRQGPFKQQYNDSTGNWEMYVTVNGQDVIFAVFETDANGDVTTFRIKGTLEEGASL